MPLPATTHPPKITTEEVAHLLRVSSQTVCLKARRGELKATKVGRRLFFNLAEIEALFADGKGGGK